MSGAGPPFSQPVRCPRTRERSADKPGGDPVEAAGEGHGDRQREDPGQRDLLHRRGLNAGVIGPHRAGDTGGEDVRCADGHAEVVGEGNRRRGHKLLNQLWHY